MRIIIIVLLIILLLWAILSPIIRLKTHPSAFWVTALTLTIIITGGFEIKWLYAENQASLMVQQISGREESTAECQRLFQAFTDAGVSVLGSVSYDEDHKARIKYYQCDEWSQFIFSDRKNLTPKQLQAIGVVFHESYHVKGEYNEAITQCLTIKHYAENLQELNVPKTEAEEYAKQYAEASKNMPPAYLNGKC